MDAYFNCKLRVKVFEILSLIKKNQRYLTVSEKLTIGQATKSTRGMPWHQEPMKDVTNCDKLRGAVSKRYNRRFPNGAIRPE